MVRIIQGAAAGAHKVTMPSEAELRQLRKIVFAHYPRLDPSRDSDYNAANFEREFRRAFLAVGHMGRLLSIETRNAKALTWWTEYAESILRDFDFAEVDVNGRTLAIAILAWGDIEHTIGPRFPFDVSLGVTHQHAGRQSSPVSWGRVLATQRLVPATPTEALREHRPGAVRVDVPSESQRMGLVHSETR